MSWSTEMLVRDRITGLHAEVARDRLARTVAGPARAAARVCVTGSWRRLMGVPGPAPVRRPSASAR